MWFLDRLVKYNPDGKTLADFAVEFTNHLGLYQNQKDIFTNIIRSFN